MNTYVYANLEGNEDRAMVWEWLLDKLYGEDTLYVDDSKYCPIEFDATIADRFWLGELIDSDSETIFHGTLKEFYKEMGV